MILKDSMLSRKLRQQPSRILAFTLVEFIVSAALGSMVLILIASLSIYGSRSFESLANYSEMDTQSRNAMDRVSREMRQCTAVISLKTNGETKWLTLTNADQGRVMKLSWDEQDRTLVFEVTGDDPQVLLRSCERWDFALYGRAPTLSPTNIIFYPATNSAGQLDPSKCKLIDMSWKCSRNILGNKMNTESVHTAQIVLRNKL
jgi:hypothetical protein